MIDTAMRKRFELMVGEFQRELDAIEEHPVCQRDNDKTEAGNRVALRSRTAGSPCIRLGARLDHEEPLSQPESDQPLKAMPPGVRKSTAPLCATSPTTC